MIKLGFADHYLDEFHANHFPEWIRGASLADEFEIIGAYAEKDKPGGLTTGEWCEKNGICAFSSLEALTDAVDGMVVLAPDEAHAHERLSAPAILAGKPVFLDKVLADDLESGKRICALAQQHGTPLYASSALRFCREFAQLPDDKTGGSDIDFLSLLGAGTFEVYIVHQIEMLVTLCGTGATRLMNIGTEKTPVIQVAFADRLAHMTVMGKVPFAAAIAYRNGTAAYLPECTDFFPLSIEAMLGFFKTKKPPCTFEDSLKVIAMHTAAHQARKKPGEWVALP